ncbi:MAG: 3-deoxy-7-phosphoheptulonate synthase [Candidatus Micrarchaeota archaeon]|nr:3-deoxy-7-phosphoheptulonate synthase [Candidatus Micrarchaeota archaeon]
MKQKMIEKKLDEEKNNKNQNIKRILRKRPLLIAGPCAIEDKESLYEIGKAVKESGAHVLRGMAFKPRTKPESFQGLGELGLQILAEVKRTLSIPVVSEIVDTKHIDLFYKYDVDILQIGSRNMDNYELLKEVGKTDKFVLLKRGYASTLEEFLGAIAYLRNAGNNNIILCERGIKAYASSTRNILDLGIVNILKTLDETKDLTIIVDPSHAAGRRDLVIPFGLAALAANADGLIVEVHNKPETALSDKDQQITLEDFKSLAVKTNRLISTSKLLNKF